MQYIVALGACFTITTTLLVGMYSLARVAMVGAREWLLPPRLSNISPRTQTPLVAQLTVGILVSVISLIFAYEKLSEIVSCGSLAIIIMVCNAYLARRYYPDVKLRYTHYGTVEATPRDLRADRFRPKMSKRVHRAVLWIHVLLINGISVGLGIYYRLTGRKITTQVDGDDDIVVYVHNQATSFLFVLGWFLVTCSMWYFCRLEYHPEKWKIPWYLLPWLPSVAILVIFFVYVCPCLPVDTSGKEMTKLKCVVHLQGGKFT